MRRIVTHDVVLGTHEECFKLKEGEEIQYFETDKYLRTKAIIQGKELLVTESALERVSNKVK